MAKTLVSLFITLGGGVIAFCSICNSDWLFDNNRARRFISMFGRTFTRAMYATIGIALLTLGAMALLGVWQLDFPPLELPPE